VIVPASRTGKVDALTSSRPALELRGTDPRPRQIPASDLPVEVYISSSSRVTYQNHVIASSHDDGHDRNSDIDRRSPGRTPGQRKRDQERLCSPYEKAASALAPIVFCGAVSWSPRIDAADQDS